MQKIAFFLLAVLFATTGHGAESKKIGLVLDKGGRDDKSFNSSAVAGAEKAKKDFGVDLKVVEMTDDNAGEGLLRSFANKKYDLIIAIGFSHADAVKKASAAFPERQFLIVDSEVNGPNVRSAMFEEHQGSFLAGAIAAMASKTGKVGFIGGMDIPLIRRFQMGYEAGAKHINPKVQVVSNFVGVTSEAWINPPKGKELASAQYSSGVDVIFGAAGASTMGIFDAAEEKNKLAIGVDSNQNWVKPGFILTSMLKRVDLAVYKAIEEAAKGPIKTGTIRYGLPDMGIELAMDQNNSKLVTKEMAAKLESLKKDIVAGKISVPDYYKK